MTHGKVGPAHQAPPANVVNPVDVENNLLRLANAIAASVRPMSVALQEYREKERAYDLAYARAFARHDGPQYAKANAALEATMGLREERDNAEAVYKYAATRVKALEQELSAWQTIARSVIVMYGAAGA